VEKESHGHKQKFN